MRFPTPLLPGTLIKRYKRFLADIRLETGEEITAHCANSGAMWGIKEPGMQVWVSPAPPESKGKLKYRWELVHDGKTLTGCHTSHPNTLAAEAIESGQILELSGYASLRREVKYAGNSRIDILLEDPEKGRCYVEVKNAHMCREAGLVEFPDAVTQRGAKHMDALAQMVNEGLRAVNLYVIQRDDCDRFTLAEDIDPTYAERTRAATATGVECLAYSCHVSTEEILIKKKVDVIFR
ncbi:DNA/RNA nuclease SfsA [Alphaproteobacteria bacterium]|nr:DNA/RNA nuclease SfsA [Alphaproteobacteria bacterium]